MMNFSRRDFLKLANRAVLTVSGLLGAGILGRFFTYREDGAAQKEVVLGLAEAYPLGSRQVLAQVPALLVHDENGFSALSLTCTHLGCTLEEEQAGLSCPCHGSVFDSQGRVLRGPATEKLPELQLELRSDGHLVVYL